MTEEQADAIAESLGGEGWQSGGEVWLVMKRRNNGTIVVISEDAICEYASEDEFEDCRPTTTILLA